MSDAQLVAVNLSASDVHDTSVPFLELMDRLQGNGVSLDLVLAGALYACGLALEARGVLLDHAKPLAQVAPLTRGYEASKQARRHLNSH